MRSFARSSALSGLVIATVLVALLLLTACSGGSGSSGRARVGAGDGGLAGLTAADALAQLSRLRDEPAGARAPTYHRTAFGDGWADLDSDGCNTRQEVLRRDLADVRFRSGTRSCTVASGTLTDPYSGRRIAFRYGPQTSDDVQIDHVVALADAWRTGASTWPADRRVRFANDLLELLAVDGGLNQEKISKDAAQWLPPGPALRCGYVERQVAVKTRYALAVTPAERAAMHRVLSHC